MARLKAFDHPGETHDSETERGSEMSFLDHLEALRWHLIRSVSAILVMTTVFFIYKDFVFKEIIFAPKHTDFLTYRALCWLSAKWNLGDALCMNTINFTVFNKDMAGQFVTHISSSFILGFVAAFPYVFWEIWRFVKPALYEKELKQTRGIVFFTSILFVIGVLFGYYLVTPFSINFLGNYQVAEEVSNQIHLGSYLDMLSMLALSSGLIFELPMVVYLFAKIGLLTPNYMRHYRKHAIVIILFLAAIITPPDVVSQVILSIPLLFLYELSIVVCQRVYNNKLKDEQLNN